jgi:hypothetical protein
MGTINQRIHINAIKLTVTSHLFNQSIGILGNRIKKNPPTLIYNLNDRTVQTVYYAGHKILAVIVCQFKKRKL